MPEWMLVPPPAVAQWLGLVGGIISALIAFLLGWLTHRWALKRTRREEWNDVALRVQKSMRNTGYISDDDVLLLENTVGYWQRKNLRKAMAGFKAENENTQVDDSGHCTFVNPESRERARQHLLTHLRLRG